MKIEIKQTVWVVVQRWNLVNYDGDVKVFDTKDKAIDYMKGEKEKVKHDIENAEVIDQGDIITVENDYNWWEATVEEKEVY